MSRVGKSPRALLDILDARTLGRAPAVYSDALGITFDAEYLYRAATPLETITESAALTSASQNTNATTTTVPANETWLLEHWSTVVTATGSPVTASACISINQSGTTLPVFLVGNAPVNAVGVSTLTGTQSALNGQSLAYPLVLNPGTIVATFIAVMTGNSNLATRLAIRRFQTS